MNTKTTYTITIGSVTRELPIREVAPDVRVALFDPLGDWELNEAIGAQLAPHIPKNVTVLLMADGKAQALLHVIGRLSGLPTVVARKEEKPYMAKPVLKTMVKSITTNKEQTLYLGANGVERLRGQKILIVDDVVSTGGTVLALTQLIEQAGGELVGVMAALTEGTPREDVIALDHLPLF